jgi:hypothetical protein
LPTRAACPSNPAKASSNSSPRPFDQKLSSPPIGPNATTAANFCYTLDKAGFSLFFPFFY